MTDLTNRTMAAIYGDFVTFSNVGQGVSNQLNNIQDGRGSPTAIQLSTNALNVNGSLLVNGLPVVSSTLPTVVSQLAADPVATPGGIYYNTIAREIRAWSVRLTAWVPLTGQ